MKKSRFVSGKNLQLVPMADHFTTRKMMNFQYVCFRTLSPRTVRKGHVYQTYRRDLLEIPKWLDMVLEFDDVSEEIDIYIHYESNFHQESGSLEKHVVRLNRNTSLKTRQTIYFKRTRRILYEDHFRSRCINYLSKWGYSKATMIQRCSSQRMIDQFSELPVDAFINESISTGVRFTRNQTRSQEIREQCDHKFHLLDCDEVFMETKVEVNHVILEGDEEYAQEMPSNQSLNILIYPPGSGYLEIHQVLRFSPIGLFAFCGGVIGAWLGLSFLHVQNSISMTAKYFR